MDTGNSASLRDGVVILALKLAVVCQLLKKPTMDWES